MNSLVDKLRRAILPNSFLRKTEEDEAIVDEIEASLSYGNVYRPPEGEILYHYCDANTFHSIIQNREIWFSDVFAMNDFAEMHWGYRIFEEVAGELLSVLPREFIDKVDERIHETGKFILPLICCFSKDGDVLSQWRAYADDGHGYAVGFAAEDLGNLPARSLEIVYDKNEQKNRARSWLMALHEVEKDEGYTYKNDFMLAVSHFAVDICAFKNPGFREELEVRYVHTINIEGPENKRKFKDHGGIAWKKKTDGQTLNFRMRQSIPVVYLKQDFSNKKRVSAIKKIILGPKNEALPTGISLYLETMGHSGIEIGKSETSYG